MVFGRAKVSLKVMSEYPNYYYFKNLKNLKIPFFFFALVICNFLGGRNITTKIGEGRKEGPTCVVCLLTILCTIGILFPTILYITTSLTLPPPLPLCSFTFASSTSLSNNSYPVSISTSGSTLFTPPVPAQFPIYMFHNTSKSPCQKAGSIEPDRTITMGLGKLDTRLRLFQSMNAVDRMRRKLSDWARRRRGKQDEQAEGEE